jgi:DNA polymerase IV
MNKIILHLDFNSFFASCEQQANPFLRGKPIAVAGKRKDNKQQLKRTVVTTASIEAKRLGVKTAMSSLEAKRICPELIIVQGDPKKYSTITKKFLLILKRYSDAVEQFSTDEAFADLTIAAGDYFGATFIAQRIRDDIRREIGSYCTASIGIAPNKLAAKLACESVKPNGLTIVHPEELESFVEKQDMRAICGIGPRIESRLHEMGISSMNSLKKTPLEQLVNEFKNYGYFLYFAARGIGNDEVDDAKKLPKSVGHSYTFPSDLETTVELQTNLLALCDKVAWRMRRDGFTANRISIYARYGNFGGVGCERRFKEPMTDGLALYKNAWKLIDSIRNPHKGIRLLGISASGLTTQKMPKSLFPKPEKIHQTLRALDTLQARYGNGIWQRAATINTTFKERTSGWHYDHEV